MKKIKKFIVYVFFVITLVNLIKIGFVKKSIQTSNDDYIEKIPYKEFDYGDYKMVKLLHVNTGSVEELPLDVYLYGVVSAEIPASFESEALKAQAIVARTYTIYQIMHSQKHKEQGADICDSSLCCQAWMSKENRMARWDKSDANDNWQKIENAVNSTIGQIILYEGQPINAFFHSNSGGWTENAINVWGGEYHYLQAVETSGEDAYSSFSSEVKISKDDLIVKMRDKYDDFKIDFNKEDCIKIIEKTETSRKN